MHERQIGIGNRLLAIGAPRQVEKIIAAVAGRRNIEGLVALRTLAKKFPCGGETEFGKRAAGEINLILERREIEILTAIGGGLSRIEKRQAMAIFAHAVQQQARGQNIG